MSRKPLPPEERPPGDGPADTFLRPTGEEGTQELPRAPSADDLREGALLAGRFSIVRFIARGGMGAVYEAEDRVLRSRVALKTIRGALLSDPTVVERFRREVLLARRVGHPNVCHVYELYDTTTVGGVPLHFLTMELLEGETLASHLRQHGRLDTIEALPLVLQMCDGLGAAHAEGVIHRDFKTSNVMLAPPRNGTGESGARRVVITDFGIARALETRGGESAEPALTGNAGIIGTPEYMAPEQITGGEVTPATDIYALGTVMYEMVTGKLPFVGDTPLVAAAKRIHQAPTPPQLEVPGLDPRWSAAIVRCLDRNPERRFRRTADLRAALAPAVTPARSAVPIYLSLAILLVGGLAAWRLGLFGGRHDERWLRADVIPEIHRLADSDQPLAAHLLAMKANAELPGNAQLAQVWRSFANTANIRSTPSGARMLWRAYGDTQGPWLELGRTPLENIWFPRDGFYQLRLELDGYRPYEAAFTYWWFLEDVPFPLDRTGTIPDSQVRVPGLAHAGLTGSTLMADYLLDRYEVTNRRYKAFVDAGGYQRKEFWKEPFVKNGRRVTWEEGIAQFTDRTGRPGPSGWELSNFPRGEDEFPVGGVSWYEAAAYAEFEGRALPTTHHWARAAGTGGARWIVPQSNFGGKGPQPVGRLPSMNRFGTFDMAGNVREWCFNEERGSGGGRFILGGGWNDPGYGFNDSYAQSPWDRSPTNGFRLVTYQKDDPTLVKTQEPVDRPFRDYRQEKPVSEADFKIFLRVYAYDRKPLHARSEQTQVTDDWTREKVSFDAAYGNERMILYLFVPKNVKPPYQPVVYFPGSNVIWASSIDQDLANWDFIVRGGRVLVYPVFRGTLERRTELASDLPNASVAYRDYVIQWARDLGRSLDYLETRPDIDTSRIGYFGWSWGGMMGGLMPAVEPRLRAAVLHVAGLSFEPSAPEVDPFNFLPRIKIPVLMLNGKLDHFFPVETSQVPMFEAFGTAPQDRRQVIYDTGHLVPRASLIRETLDWYDRYLGPVGGARRSVDAPK